MAATKKKAKSSKAKSYSSDVLALHWIGGLLLIALGVLAFMAIELGMVGSVFAGLRSVCYGLFGFTAIALPLFPCWWGGLLILSSQHRVSYRPFILSFLLYLLVAATAELLTFTGSVATPLLDYLARNYSIRTYGDFLQKAYDWSYSMGMNIGRAGGLAGMLLAWPLWRVGGSIPSAILCILLALVDCIFLFHVDVNGLIVRIRDRKSVV